MQSSSRVDDETSQLAVRAATLHMVLVVALVLALVGCSQVNEADSSRPTQLPTPGVTLDAGSAPPTPPPGSLARDTAIAFARSNAPGATAATKVVWAQVGPNPFVEASEPTASGIVWMVRLEGVELAGGRCGAVPPPASAGPLASPCVDEAGGYVVVLDRVTGALLGWTN